MPRALRSVQVATGDHAAWGEREHGDGIGRFCIAHPAGEDRGGAHVPAALNGSRKGEYGESERNIGITKELWFLQQTPNGDLFVAYLESPDAARALGMFSQSREPFDSLVQGATRRHHGDGYEYSAPGPAQRVALAL